MTILLSSENKVLVQGITGVRGRFHAQWMTDYGTQIVGGVSPGKGGDWINGFPVFDSVALAVETTDADTSIIFVPPVYATDAIYEAADAGISLIVCITDGIPILDLMKAIEYLKRRAVRLVGPNCPGILSPELASVGIIPTESARRGKVGVVSRSGALMYDVVNTLTTYDIGQSTIIGIGGDPVIGTGFVDVLELFENDPDTDQVVLLGEIGGRAEVDAANYIKSSMTKPVIACIVGQSAPEDHRMGHAGAIIEGGYGTAQEKIEALKNAGARVVANPEEIVSQLSES